MSEYVRLKAVSGGKPLLKLYCTGSFTGPAVQAVVPAAVAVTATVTKVVAAATVAIATVIKAVAAAATVAKVVAVATEVAAVAAPKVAIAAAVALGTVAVAKLRNNIAPLEEPSRNPVSRQHHLDVPPHSYKKIKVCLHYHPLYHTHSPHEANITIWRLLTLEYHDPLQSICQNYHKLVIITPILSK